MSNSYHNYMSHSDIMECDPIELFNWIQNNYIDDIPVSLETVDELQAAGNRLGELTNLYSYFISLVTIANIHLKECKREKKEKEIIDTAMARRDILQNTVDVLKMQYTAISRMITVKKQVDDELKML